MSDRESKEELFERYQRVLRMMRSFRSRTEISLTRFAEFTKVARVELNKFLNEDPDYIPTPRRTAKVIILRKLENFLQTSTVNHILVLAAPERVLDPNANYRMKGAVDWMWHHADEASRLVKVPAATAFDHFPRLFVQACGAPREFQFAFCANVLIPIKMKMRDLVDHGGRGCPERLVSDVRHIVLELTELGMNSAHGSYEAHSHRILASLGCFLSLEAILLNRAEQFEQGITEHLRACEMPHESAEQHWDTLFKTLEAGLTKGLGVSREMARMVGERVREKADADMNLQKALRDVKTAQLGRVWRDDGLLVGP